MKEIYSLNSNWKFKKESEIVSEASKDYFDMYRSNTKTGIMSGAKSSFFYDEEWETVNLPHDWVIEEEPCEKYAGSQGFRPQGAVWYRKHFIIDKKYENKKIFLKFDGIATASEIYFNNFKVASSEGGYTPVTVDVTDFVSFDKNNTVAVRADSSVKEGWWYEGGGIYRNTYLIIKEQSHFVDDGVFISTKNNGNGIWTVNISAETVNGEECEITAELNGEITDKSEFTVKKPLLWDSENPNLYEITVRLSKKGVLCDEEKIKFGFREVQFDKDRGFFINGKNEKLKGVCLHHDHAGVGVALDKSIIRFRMKKLRKMGCNAIRTSHNPQSPEFYEICDELGFYIMNEVRHFSSTQTCLRELESFVKRDRNHPSVIMWSLFNEEPLQCSATGERIMETMIKTLHRYDKTRPITGGMNGPLEISGVVKYVDVMGFNYLQYGYDEFHELFPDIPIIGSETGSYLSTRDEMKTVSENSHVCCFGRKLKENLCHWSDTPGGTWKYISERPFVAGGFYWTGIDYYGETGPFNWPGITSNFGAMDICGFPKDCYFWHKALWAKEYMLEITHPWVGTDGEILEIVCYSNCETIELFVNGRSLGEKKNNVYSPEIHKIPYEKGVLKAVGRINGKIVCEKEIRDYGEKRILEIVSDNDKISVNDSIIFNVYLKDEYGQLVKTDSHKVKAVVENGVIIGSGNGDNANLRSSKSDVQPLFHGCAQFIVKPLKGGKTVIRIMNTECAVSVSEAEIKAIDSVSYKAYAYNHRMSDIHEAYPTAEQITDNGYTWIPTMINVPKSLMMSGKKGFAVVSNAIDIPNNPDKSVLLIIEKIKGDFQVYYGKNKIYDSNGFYFGDVKIPIDGGLITEKQSVGIVFELNGSDVEIAGNIYAEIQ